MLPNFSGDLGEEILQGIDPAFCGRSRQSLQRRTRDANIILHLLPPYSPELNPQENIWDEIREKIFKNYALKSMSDANAKLDEASFYIERSRTLVKSIASFPYIAKSY
jgi:transposase